MLLVLASAWALAGPASAGNGGSHTVTVLPAAPSIDGTLAFGEWDAATSFPVTFGNLSGTAYVGRTSTDLYLALTVNDTAGAGDSAFYFDNADDGVIDVGDDLIAYNTGDGVGTDWHWSGTSTISRDEFSGGTNDVTAAATYSGGVRTFEYRHPLCSSDTTHDFCFVRPPTSTSPPAKIGFDVSYRTAAGVSAAFPAGITDGAGYAEFVIDPDTTPPPAPHLNISANTASSLSFIDDGGSYIAWYRPDVDGSFTLTVPADEDPESGIASATFPTTQATGWTDTAGATPRARTFAWTATPATRQAGDVVSTNGSGLAGAPRRLSFIEDTLSPTGTLTCVPSSCTNGSGPVLVTVQASDSQSGVRELRYTSDNSEPNATNGTVVQSGETIRVTSDALVQLWGVDNVGNEDLLTGKRATGAAAPTTPNGRIIYESSRPDPAPGPGVNDPSHLFALDPEDPEPRPETQLGAGSPVFHADASRDGTKLAWTLVTVDGSLIMLGDPDGNNGAAVSGTGADWPAISPDGTRLAYARDVTGQHDIFVLNIGTGAVTNITTSSGVDEIMPSWSPDGSMIAYAAKGTPGGGTTYDVVTQASAAGAAKNDLTPTTNANEQDPAWSPDGTAIAFDNDAGHTWAQVWTMGPEGQSPHPLTTSYPGFNDAGDMNADPSFSPDGSKITFVFSPGGTQNFDVFTMNADGTGRTPMFAANGTHEGFPTWARGTDQQAGPTFVVNTDSDHAPDRTGCTVQDCTLREAVAVANAAEGPNTVAFDIKGPGIHTISLTSSLVLTDDGTTIDGYTQAGATPNSAATGFNGTLTIALDGANVVGSIPPAIEVNSGNNVIQGLQIGTAIGTGFTYAIRTFGVAAENNVIRGNILGTPTAPNTQYGIDLRGSSSNSIVGGPEPADRNLIAGNTGGGVDISGSGAAPNLPTRGIQIVNNVIQSSRIGVIMQVGVVSNTIRGNEISNNSEQGIVVFDGATSSSIHNRISQNSIHDNGGLGIDLNGDGVTLNDRGDFDTGPNLLQNFPILGVPVVKGSTMTLAARLTSQPSTSYVIEAFGNATCDASGFGEGQTLLGTRTVTTSPFGVVTFTLSFEIGNPPGGVSLTATEAKNGDTSEFSACRAPQTAGTNTSATVTLTSNKSSSEAGASIVTLDSLPRGAFGPPPAPIESSPIESSPIESSPIESSPIESSPIESSPIESSPIESSPIESSGFTTTNLEFNQLGGVPLSDLPLLHGKTWAGVLGKDVQLQSTTLADALTIKPGLSGLTVGDIDWAHSNSPLASLAVGAFALGPAKLSQLPPKGDPSTALADWCAAINAIQGFQCSSAGDLTNTTVMDIALQGVPIESSGLGTTPIESSDLSGTPIESSPIESSDIAGTPIESSPLSAVDLGVSPLGDISLAAVVAAGSPIGDLPFSAIPATVATCATTCAKLSEATIAPTAKVRDIASLLGSFTVGDLKVYPGVTFGNIGRGLPPDVNIRDLLRALFAKVPFDPETLPLDGIQTVADAGGLVTYTANITLNGTGTGNGFAQLRASIPADARYKPGSTDFRAGGVSLAKNDPGVINGQLAWDLNGLTFGTTYQLVFQVYPGLQLGTDTTSVTLLPAGLPAASAAPVNIAVTDTLEGATNNDTPANAATVAAGKLYISFEQTQADTDWYTMPVPAAGTVTTFTLSHLTNDKDLVVYAPAGQPLRSSPIESSPIEASPIEASPVLDPPPTLQHSTDSLQPAAVQDIPIESSQLDDRVIAGVSDNAGTAIESVTVVSSGGPGAYLIHVIATDSEPTNEPYVVHVDSEPPALPAACPTLRTFPFPAAGQPGVLPSFGSVPATTKTMILVDYKRYGDTYGLAAENTLKTKLNAFAARSDIGGVVLPVEGNAAVQAAYNTWDTNGNSCSPEAANGVVRAIISNIVDPFRATHLNIKFLVIVGGDDLIPFPRIPDNSTTANERDYVNTIGYPTDAAGNPLSPTNNSLVGTAAASYMQTDDVWSAFNPLPLSTAPLYLPQWATGRLVETPNQIVGQLDSFGTGTINPTTQLTAGYDFLADSSTAVATQLKTFAPNGPGDLINDTWTHTDLLGKLQLGNSPTAPKVVSVNAHFDHHRAQPAAGDPLADTTELQAVPNGELARLIFSVGCHSGYAVPNVFYTYPFSFDWPEADFTSGAVARVANTTYGYGDTDIVGYSEQVELNFAKRLTEASLGEALLYAKHQYVADLAAIGAFEQKSLNALTFYGLPMLRIGTGTTPGTPSAPTIVADPLTGLQSLPITSGPFTFPQVQATGGSYFNGPDGVDATNNRPYEPKKIFTSITAPNLVPHGFLVTGLDGIDPHPNFLAARSRAVPDATLLTPKLDSQLGWPSGVSRITSFLTPTGPRQQLVLLHGQFLSDPDGSGKGTQTNFGTITGSVLYSLSRDALPPLLAHIRVTKVGSSVAFELDATDAVNTTETQPSGKVKTIVVVYYEPGATTATRITLLPTGAPNHWAGAGPLSGSSASAVNYIIQAVDLAGNVGISVHKVLATKVALDPPPEQGHLTITPSGTPVGNGWFGGNVSVTLGADEGFKLSYSIDGGQVKTYTGQPFVVSGDGIHIVDAFANNAAGVHVHAAAAVPIDSGPTITIVSPIDGGTYFTGSVVNASYSCADPAAGIAACVGTVANGTPISTTASPTTKTFTVTARDNLNRTRTKTVTYQVWAFNGFLPPIANPPMLNVAKAGNSIPIKFSLGGDRGLNLFAPGYPLSAPMQCPSSAPTQPIDTTNSTSQPGLTYDRKSNQYTYTWKTQTFWAGTCRQLTLLFAGGEVRFAFFQFK